MQYWKCVDEVFESVSDAFEKTLVGGYIPNIQKEYDVSEEDASEILGRALITIGASYIAPRCKDEERMGTCVVNFLNELEELK